MNLTGVLLKLTSSTSCDFHYKLVIRLSWNKYCPTL